MIKLFFRVSINGKILFTSVQRYWESFTTELYTQTNPDKHLGQIKDILSAILTLKPDKETAFQYANTREALTKQGNLIPANDIWIAAVAIQHGLTQVRQNRLNTG